ncbi:response regulator transcription factor [Adlercreutzia shanghongiae]|uniref:Helix-turn-helix transcriptional regulator n=1 Tax=Adlercreutzia shanghongiae TaxID=3111773 RepID=A0ABU6J228_9ACTN|nr:helix-turn-helix transcriptional regulator [Adlercreutzia sp. R22]MEC4295981.1 helix-turn-helix transcriptional regulator [Adlercreutzia sp. R22]
MGTYREQFAVSSGGAFSAIALTGLWTQQVWIFWLNTAAAAPTGFFPWQGVYLITGLAMLAFAGLALFWRPEGPKLWALDGLAAAAGSAGTLIVVLFLVGVVDGELAGVAKIAATVGYAWAYLRWGQFYGALHIRQAVAYLFTAGIAAALLKFVLLVVPLTAAGVAVVALPVLSLVLCRRALALDAGSAAPKVSAPYLSKGNAGALWKVVAVIAVFSFANASMLSFQAPGESLGGPAVFAAARLVDAALCAGILVLVFGLRKSFDFPQLWKIVLFVLATDFLCELIVPDAGMQALFSGVSLNFIVLFVWLTLADVARHSAFSSSVVFGVGWSCYVLSFYVGSLAASSSQLQGLGGSYVVVLLYAVAMTLAFCLESRDPNIAYIFDDLANRPAASPSDFDDIDGRCEALGASRGLTPREIEVMQLFCKGRTKAYIAETMYVTENTVRSHIKHIYTKLDAHSREDIQKLIDAF